MHDRGSRILRSSVTRWYPAPVWRRRRPDNPLATPLQYLKGVGPRRAADFAHIGLLTVDDLLSRFPIRYEDRSRLQPIASLRAGHTASVAGRILSCGLRSTRRPGFKIFEALVADESGALRSTWLNQPFLRDVFKAGQRVVLFGSVDMRGQGGLQLTNPQYEILDDEEGETIHTGRIVPVYEKAGSVTPKIQRKLVHDVLAAAASRSSGRPAGGASGTASAAVEVGGAARDPLSTGRRGDRRAESLRHARAAAADLRRGLHVSGGHAPPPAYGDAGAQNHGDPRGRPYSRVGAAGAAVQADGGAEAGAEGDRRRHAAAASDESSAAGRCRGRQDDRRAAGGARGDGERATGRVHGADRDPRGAALFEHRAAAAAVPLPRWRC